jgi:hypothetical protein
MLYNNKEEFSSTSQSPMESQQGLRMDETDELIDIMAFQWQNL